LRTETSIWVGGHIGIESDSTRGGTGIVVGQVHEVVWTTFQAKSVCAMGTISWTGRTLLNVTSYVNIEDGLGHITSRARYTIELVLTLGTTILTLLTSHDFDIGVVDILNSLLVISLWAGFITRGWSQVIVTWSSKVEIRRFTLKTIITSGTRAGGTLGVTLDAAV
jgi:hypothetical protein